MAINTPSNSTTNNKTQKDKKEETNKNYQTIIQLIDYAPFSLGLLGLKSSSETEALNPISAYLKSAATVVLKAAIFVATTESFQKRLEDISPSEERLVKVLERNSKKTLSEKTHTSSLKAINLDILYSFNNLYSKVREEGTFQHFLKTGQEIVQKAYEKSPKGFLSKINNNFEMNWLNRFIFKKTEDLMPKWIQSHMQKKDIKSFLKTKYQEFDNGDYDEMLDNIYSSNNETRLEKFNKMMSDVLNESYQETLKATIKEQFAALINECHLKSQNYNPESFKAFYKEYIKPQLEEIRNIYKETNYDEKYYALFQMTEDIMDEIEHNHKPDFSQWKLENNVSDKNQQQVLKAIDAYAEKHNKPKIKNITNEYDLLSQTAESKFDAYVNEVFNEDVQRSKKTIEGPIKNPIRTNEHFPTQQQKKEQDLKNKTTIIKALDYTFWGFGALGITNVTGATIAAAANPVSTTLIAGAAVVLKASTMLAKRDSFQNEEKTRQPYEQKIVNSLTSKNNELLTNKNNNSSLKAINSSLIGLSNINNFYANARDSNKVIDFFLQGQEKVQAIYEKEPNALLYKMNNEEENNWLNRFVYQPPEDLIPEDDKIKLKENQLKDAARAIQNEFDTHDFQSAMSQIGDIQDKTQAQVLYEMFDEVMEELCQETLKATVKDQFATFINECHQIYEQHDFETFNKFYENHFKEELEKMANLYDKTDKDPQYYTLSKVASQLMKDIENNQKPIFKKMGLYSEQENKEENHKLILDRMDYYAQNKFNKPTIKNLDNDINSMANAFQEKIYTRINNVSKPEQQQAIEEIKNSQNRIRNAIN